jgi:hypothetical protein
MYYSSNRNARLEMSCAKLPRGQVVSNPLGEAQGSNKERMKRRAIRRKALRLEEAIVA